MAVNRYECQVCDRYLRYVDDEELQRKGVKWSVIIVADDDEDLALKIIACPTCTKHDGPTLLTNYMRRIKSGRDRRFH